VISLRPESWLPWLTILGFGAYVVTWLGRRRFYAALGVTPELVGVDYPSLFLPAAVVAVFVVLTLVMVSAFIVPFFMPISRRAAIWQMKVGGWIFLAVIVGSVAAGALLGEDSAESVGVVMTLPVLFGALFFGHGFGAWFGRSATRRAVRSRIRRLDKEHRPRGQGLTAYLEQQRDRRRRKATRRARAASIRREATPSTTVYLLWCAAVLFITLGAYLSDAAARAAHHAANGTTPFVGADLPANVLLNLHVRRVKVEAIAPQFRPLQGAQLLYLGTNAGAYVLYNRTAREALIIPSGAVALRFDPQPAKGISRGYPAVPRRAGIRGDGQRWDREEEDNLISAETSLRTALSSGCSQSGCADQAAPRAGSWPLGGVERRAARSASRD
jgi:hypothetical protein